MPVVVGRNAEFLKASWDTLYAVGYVGMGTFGYGRTVYTHLVESRQDAGVGFEVSFQLLRYRVFASALAVRAVGGPGDPRFLMTLRTVN